MRTSFTVSDMTIHRIVEQEYGFTPLFEDSVSFTRRLEQDRRTWREVIQAGGVRAE